MDAADVDTDLAKALQVAKKKPRNFAIIAKGANVLKLLVDKKPIKEGVLIKAKKECQGTAIVTGVVSGDSGELVFQVLEEPSIGPPKLKKFITDATRLTITPRFQVVTAIRPVDDDAEESTEDPAVAQSPPAASETPPPPPPPPDSEKAGFAARLKALRPDLEKVRAADTSVTEELNRRAAELAALAKGEAYDSANRLLNEVTELITRGLQELASRTAGEGDPATAFNARLKALMPALKAAIAAGTALSEEIKREASQAGALAQQKAFPQAHRSLDQVESLLQGRSAAASASGKGDVTPPPPSEGISIVKLGKARLEWESVRREAIAELEELKEAILEAYQEDSEAQAAVGAALNRLNAVFTTLNDDLYRQLDDVLNASEPDERRSKVAVAKKTLQAFWAYATTDPLMATLDDNGFLEDTQIAGPILAKLDEIAAALG